MAKWVVTEFDAGCLPESEPADFDRKKDAVEHAQDLAQELRELGYKVSGSRGNYVAEREYGTRFIETERTYE